MRARLLLVPLVAASQLGATDCGTVLRDPGFDLWCDDSLCTWKVVRGEVRRAPTWHDGDTGVELVGPDAAIQQLASVNSSDGNCIRFDLVSDVEETAEVFLDVDLQGDGTVELHERIATSSWRPSSYQISIAPPYDGIRFALTKRGPGTAVLAQIHAELSDECTGLTPISAGPRADGAACTLAEECASGRCLASPQPPPASYFGQACASCDVTLQDCGTDMTCGLGDPSSPILAVPLACIPRESRELGERCLSSTECASLQCSATGGDVGVCSACTASSQCGGAATCAGAWTEPTLGQPVGPLVCNPGQGTGAPGSGCGAHVDCASGVCNGSERKECRDGRACGSPADCGVDDGLVPQGCTTVGIQGGSCQ